MLLTRMLILDTPTKWPLRLAVISFAAVLARPDALLVIIGMGLAGLVIERPPITVPPRLVGSSGAPLPLSAGLVSLFFTLQMLFQIPTTPRMLLRDKHSPRGFSHYLIASLRPLAGTSGGTVILILQLALLGGGVYAVVKRFPRCGYLVAVVVAQSVFILLSGGDWMQGARFAAPAIIPAVILEVLGLVSVFSYVYASSSTDLRGMHLRRTWRCPSRHFNLLSGVPCAGMASEQAVDGPRLDRVRELRGLTSVGDSSNSSQLSSCRPIRGHE